MSRPNRGKSQRKRKTFSNIVCVQVLLPVCLLERAFFYYLVRGALHRGFMPKEPVGWYKKPAGFHFFYDNNHGSAVRAMAMGGRHVSICYPAYLTRGAHLTALPQTLRHISAIQSALICTSPTNSTPLLHA